MHCVPICLLLHYIVGEKQYANRVQIQIHSEAHLMETLLSHEAMGQDL